ncbi:unnamed protein product [Heligmosomoides polygyrus]|uniref:SFM domain-containing protein n=1 Tax=Heligmosomoides polygyrus TaxID=6339 RepID=A0A183FAR0_HELPZ|nr:unnamed protein product [Heligmosomoides polygyrus]
MLAKLVGKEQARRLKRQYRGIEIVDAEADMNDLLERRKANKKEPSGATKLEAEMLSIARKGMDGDEATFSVEQPLEAQVNALKRLVC